MPSYRCYVWFGSETTSARLDSFTVEASNLQGAVGRAARVARKQVKGRFNTATVTVEPEDSNDLD